MRMMPSIASEPWMLGGDLNTSVLYDSPKPHGNQQILDRVAEIGLPNIAVFDGGFTPTFLSPRKQFIHQLDYLFANSLLSDHLTDVQVGDAARILEPRPMLSDHLPIIADFDVREGSSHTATPAGAIANPAGA